MKSFIEILKTILPAIVTGIFTFIVTKYNYTKNIPLDKMETAYDKIYYPIYNLLHKKEFKDTNLEQVIFETSIILNKYNNFADRSTINALDLLKKNRNKEMYFNFKNNITNKYLYLRRRLGYLEPNFLQIYTYSSRLEKSTFRLLFEFTILYICAIFYSFSKGILQNILLYITCFSIIIIFLEFLIFLFMTLISKVKKFRKFIKLKIKKLCNFR